MCVMAGDQKSNEIVRLLNQVKNCSGFQGMSGWFLLRRPSNIFRQSYRCYHSASLVVSFLRFRVGRVCAYGTV